MISIHEKYNKTVLAELKKQLGKKNDFEVTHIEKAIVNVGIGRFLNDSGMVTDVEESLKIITGQKPLRVKAKKSIAGFKIREGQEVGLKVTLRGRRMWDFLDRMVGAALPRIKDFHGIKLSAVDANGNINMGIKEHMIFPEILPEQVKNVFPLQVIVTTTAKDQEEGMALFRLLGFPMETKE